MPRSSRPRFAFELLLALAAVAPRALGSAEEPVEDGCAATRTRSLRGFRLADSVSFSDGGTTMARGRLGRDWVHLHFNFALGGGDAHGKVSVRINSQPGPWPPQPRGEPACPITRAQLEELRAAARERAGRGLLDAVELALQRWGRVPPNIPPRLSAPDWLATGRWSCFATSSYMDWGKSRSFGPGENGWECGFRIRQFDARLTYSSPSPSPFHLGFWHHPDVQDSRQVDGAELIALAKALGSKSRSDFRSDSPRTDIKALREQIIEDARKAVDAEARRKAVPERFTAAQLGAARVDRCYEPARRAGEKDWECVLFLEDVEIDVLHYPPSVTGPGRIRLGVFRRPDVSRMDVVPSHEELLGLEAALRRSGRGPAAALYERIVRDLAAVSAAGRPPGPPGFAPGP